MKRKEYTYQFQYRDTTLKRLKQRQELSECGCYMMYLDLKKDAIVQM